MALNNFEKECESKIRFIIKELSSHGVSVRREKLTRGPSFKVKSGSCHLSGSNILFVDRRLPIEQQLQMLEEQKSLIN